jgi:NADPH:quinone reductase-like Zn-dependent oxidoreductase
MSEIRKPKVMKAIVYREYGSADVLKCEDVEKPVPKDDEVLIKTRAASVNPLDWRLMQGTPSVVRLMARVSKKKPGRLGVDVAGEIEAAGKNVTRFKPGDKVFGACEGAFAEYTCTRDSKLANKPESMTFEQAAAVNVAGLTALQGLRDKGKIQAGHKVLINGAAGGVGTFAVQIAKSFGAEVTAVCSTRNVELVKSIGADAVIDYTKEDFTELPQRYDVILECVGNKSLSQLRGVLTPKGRCVLVGGAHDVTMSGMLGTAFSALVWSAFASKKVVMFIAQSSASDLELMAELIAGGKLNPVIEKRYSLNDVRDAVSHVEEGHARGKVIITVDPKPVMGQV